MVWPAIVLILAACVVFTFGIPKRTTRAWMVYLGLILLALGYLAQWVIPWAPFHL